MLNYRISFLFFFFNDPATTEIYPLPLHDALPICPLRGALRTSEFLFRTPNPKPRTPLVLRAVPVDCDNFSFFFGKSFGLFFLGDRKSTRLNSSHSQISYAVFCLKKKK